MINVHDIYPTDRTFTYLGDECGLCGGSTDYEYEGQMRRVTRSKSCRRCGQTGCQDCLPLSSETSPLCQECEEGP